MLEGEIHTQSADGLNVIQQKETHMKLDVPVTNRDYIARSQENILAGIQVMAAAIEGHQEPNEPHRIYLH